jgi:hypothetical protein
VNGLSIKKNLAKPKVAVKQNYSCVIFWDKWQIKVMETLEPQKVSIVLCPDKKENGSKGKNIVKSHRVVHALWHTLGKHG